MCFCGLTSFSFETGPTGHSGGIERTPYAQPHFDLIDAHLKMISGATSKPTIRHLHCMLICVQKQTLHPMLMKFSMRVQSKPQMAIKANKRVTESLALLKLLMILGSLCRNFISQRIPGVQRFARG